MDSRQVIARFEVERQALALMDHPNIARVLDAGTTGGTDISPAQPSGEPGALAPGVPPAAHATGSPLHVGRPYFVMELVRGVPITEFCDEAKLDTRARLELFVLVCQAVQHAHQKGIIHRDLKPGNVLVTMHDDKAVPKVIDFGVAKATSQRLTEQTIYTQFSQMVGTPLYMSPEQAQMSGLDVDTRSDVYSLGVLLYELLTGNTPFDRATLRDAGYDEMRRIIREVEPPRPSAQVSTLKAQELSTVSEKRGADPRKLSHQLRGELDWIVMKALEKDRARRYESASALAADVQRYLDNEAVHACPPSATYRLRKLAGHHKTGLTAAAFVLISLVLGTGVSVSQAVKATHAKLAVERQKSATDEQRVRAEANLDHALGVVDKLLSEVAEDVLFNQARSEPLRRKLLTDALGFCQAVLDDQATHPNARLRTAQAQRQVGEILRLTGKPEEGHTHYEQAVALLEELVDEAPDRTNYRAELARTLNGLAQALRDLGKANAANDRLDRSLEIQRQLVAEEPTSVDLRMTLAATHFKLGRLVHCLGKRGESEQAFREALQGYEKLVDSTVDQHELLRAQTAAWTGLGNLLGEFGRLEESEVAINAAVAAIEPVLADSPEDPKTRELAARAYDRLAYLCFFVGRTQDALDAYDKSLPLAESLVEDFPEVPLYRQRLARTHKQRATALGDCARQEEAEREFGEALELLDGLADARSELPE